MTATGHPACLTHLQRLEAEAIHILREVVAEADKPVMLYSVGKDSAVMLHLAVKAFWPSRPPFPLQPATIGRRNGRHRATDLGLAEAANAEALEAPWERAVSSTWMRARLRSSEAPLHIPE